jgi:hypothetical protein
MGRKAKTPLDPHSTRDESWLHYRRKDGRPQMSPDDRKIVLAQKLRADKSTLLGDISQTLRVSRSRLYRYVRIAKKVTDVDSGIVLVGERTQTADLYRVDELSH